MSEREDSHPPDDRGDATEAVPEQSLGRAAKSVSSWDAATAKPKNHPKRGVVTHVAPRARGVRRRWCGSGRPDGAEPGQNRREREHATQRHREHGDGAEETPCAVTAKSTTVDPPRTEVDTDPARDSEVNRSDREVEEDATEKREQEQGGRRGRPHSETTPFTRAPG
ncbi:MULTISPECIES: hypothetical protein [Haloarcula]|uniref:hypothetical protein n=1 Tax=Haloarcula TaxID=2237 RepID=UPI0023EB15E8|nr:hypothetical protein [Halomicroarcula sp. XH51]